MEKTRLKKGEKYWSFGEDYDISQFLECGSSLNSYHYEQGLYFRTKEEAESVVRKLRAVLNGADVIELPSEEEIEDAMKTSVTESIMCVSPLNSFTPQATDLLECAWIKGAEWLKSKIVK